MLEPWWRTASQVSEGSETTAEEVTYDSPFETQKDLADQENFLAGCKEHNKEEASHHTKRAEQNLAWSKCLYQPAVDDRAQN
jgi:hypothetical protein